MIHASAIVHDDARFHSSSEIGPYAVIGADVELAENVRIGPHAVIEGPTRIGAGTEVGAHAVLGRAPQDLDYAGEPTRLEIGAHNVIREFVSIHRGSTKDEWITRVGDHNYLMANCHIGHDCRLGNHIVTAPGTVVGGHVEIGDYANISGLCAIHQHVRIGAYAMVGGGTIAIKDIPPYVMAAGNHARLYGLNRRGLLRHGFNPDVLKQIRRAYRLLFQSTLRLQDALAQIEQDAALECREVRHLLAFIRASQRGVMR